MTPLQTFQTTSFNDLRLPEMSFNLEDILETFAHADNTKILILETSPAIVRLLLPARACDSSMKVTLDLFLKNSQLTKEVQEILETPLLDFPQMPLHRHDSSLKIEILRGEFSNRFGIGTLDQAPAAGQMTETVEGKYFECDNPRYWHQTGVIGDLAICLTASSRERFEGEPSTWRPRLRTVSRSLSEVADLIHTLASKE